MQGGFSVGQNMMKAQWVPHGAERAWALLVIGYGTTLSKNLASLTTPYLAATYGWQAAARVYGIGALAYAALWQLLAKEHPTAAAASRALAAKVAVTAGGTGGKRRRHSLWALLTAPPHLANFFEHAMHDMFEFQILAAWGDACTAHRLSLCCRPPTG